MLLFKKKFLEQIRRGEKTQTIRFWTCRRMKSGQRSYVPGVGYIAIVSVEPVELALLTDADAMLDGFLTADSLRAELRSLYTTAVRKQLIPYRIRFLVYPPCEQQRITQERQRQKQEQKQNCRQRGEALRQELVSQTLEKLQKICETSGVENEQ